MGSTLKQLRYRPFVASVLPVVVVALCLLALFVLAPSSEARTTSGGTYRGMTSQGQPGVIITPNGRRITVAKVQVSLRCDNGVPLILPMKWQPMPVLPNGTFGAVISGSDEVEGATVSLFERISGRFSKDRSELTARIRSKFTIREADGTSVACDSRTVTLHAHL